MTVIKTATHNELEQLLPLFEKYRAFYGKKAAPAESLEFLRDRLKNEEAVIYLAYQDNKLAGFVQLFKCFSSTRLAYLWILNDLYTDSEFRNKKIGAELINHAKDLVRKTKACGMMLETQKDNAPGNHLYPACGFEKMDDVNHFYWPNEIGN